MAGRGTGPDFVEALARGLDVLAASAPTTARMSLSEVAAAAGLARPTARRLLLTLEELGFVRSSGGPFELTPKVLTLGMAYVSSLGLWDIARPHLEALVARTGESSSMAQLDGSRHRLRRPRLGAQADRAAGRDRHPVPGRADLAGQGAAGRAAADELAAVLAVPSRSGLPPYIGRSPDQLRDELTEVRARGWALADEELAPGVRSVAVPVRDGTGAVRAADERHRTRGRDLHARRCSDEHLPLLLRTAGDISAEWALWQARPQEELRRGARGPATA